MRYNNIAIPHTLGHRRRRSKGVAAWHWSPVCSSRLGRLPLDRAGRHHRHPATGKASWRCRTVMRFPLRSVRDDGALPRTLIACIRPAAVVPAPGCSGSGSVGAQPDEHHRVTTADRMGDQPHTSARVYDSCDLLGQSASLCGSTTPFLGDLWPLAGEEWPASYCRCSSCARRLDTACQ